MKQSIIPSLAAIKRPRDKASPKGPSRSSRPHKEPPKIHWLEYGGEMGMPALTACLRPVSAVRADQQAEMVTCWKCLERIEARANPSQSPPAGKRARASARRRKQRSQARTSRPASVEPALPVGSGR